IHHQNMVLFHQGSYRQHPATRVVLKAVHQDHRRPLAALKIRNLVTASSLDDGMFHAGKTQCCALQTPAYSCRLGQDGQHTPIDQGDEYGPNLPFKRPHQLSLSSTWSQNMDSNWYTASA